MSSLVQIAPPAIEPITLAEARTHLRLDLDNLEPTPGAPTVALAGLGAGNVDEGTHFYAVTFVTANGETNAGDLSAAITVADDNTNGQVQITNIPLGGSQVIKRRLYRTPVYDPLVPALVAEIADNTTTSYTDNVADFSLGAEVPTTNTTGDALLADLITAARVDAELFQGRAFIAQRWRYTLDTFPPTDLLELPRPNLISVDSATYLDTSGTLQTLDPTIYTVDTDHLPGRLVLAYGKYWPFTRAIRNTVFIEFTAGYGTTGASVPATTRAAIKLRLTDLWENRVAAGTKIGELDTVGRLLWRDRYVSV